MKVGVRARVTLLRQCLVCGRKVASAGWLLSLSAPVFFRGQGGSWCVPGCVSLVTVSIARSRAGKAVLHLGARE